MIHQEKNMLRKEWNILKE